MLFRLWFCEFALRLGAADGLQYMIVALPGFFIMYMQRFYFMDPPEKMHNIRFYQNEFELYTHCD